MVNIFNRSLINKLFVYRVTLSSFTIACIAPQTSFAYECNKNVFDQVGMMARLEKIVSKIMKQKKKGSVNSLMKLLIEFKGEIESFSGEKIDIDDCMKEVKKECEKKGYKLTKKELSVFKKKIKSLDKKNNRYLDISLKSDDDKDEEDEEIQIPMMMAFGITLALCGVFLCVLPIPQSKAWGVDLIKTGVLIATEEGIRNQKEEKKGK